MRTFEAAACGAFQLVDDRTALHSLFDPPNDLVAYASVDELTALIGRYLHDPDARREAAERARSRALREHTYAKRLGQLLDTVRAEP